MSLRLTLVSLWMPRSMMAREVERIRASTDAALDSLLARHAPELDVEGPKVKVRSLEDRRTDMARSHERKVRALVENLGRERAISVGREALFQTGLALGRGAKARLGVKDTRSDMLKAATVLYRILGIEFVIVAGPQGERMEVIRCSLSHHYSRETCSILSAVDEGTFKGLCPGADLRFREHITDGSPRCVAIVDFGESA
jgi:hypothetical protein